MPGSVSDSYDPEFRDGCEWCSGTGQVSIRCPAAHHNHMITVPCGRCHPDNPITRLTNELRDNLEMRIQPPQKRSDE